MANIENNPEKNDEQGSEFAKNQKLKSDVYDAIEEQLIKSTEAAFKSEGIKTREPKDAKGEQGWNRGVYGDGTTYGTGVKKGQDTVTINRVKGPKATNGFFEKNLSYGGKKMVAEIHVDIDCESETMDFTYQTTEQAAFRGHQDEKNGAYMINNKQTFKVDNISDFKKDLKKVLDKFADKEAAYFFSTKLGIEDRTEKSINSMVESNMKKLSLTDILKGDFNETLGKIMESAKKEVEPNSKEVKSANSKDNLLFDEEEEDTVDEVTASGGGAGAGGYLTPGAFGKGGDFDDEMSEGLDDLPETGSKVKQHKGGVKLKAKDNVTPGHSEKKKIKLKEDDIHSKLQERFEETPYSKRNKKRALKRENVDGWTTVELDDDGYAPKGMDKNHALGLHGVEVNSAEEDKLSKGSPKGRAGMKGKAALGESFDPSKKKFTSLTENEDKGVNKRYIITHQKTKEEESNRWKALSGFDKNSTIKLAESCGGEIEDGTSAKIVSREQGEEQNMKEFMQRNSGVDHGDEIEGKAVVVVDKPGSLSGAEFKVFEDEYLNEGKAFILDMNSGNLVNNPNYKKALIETVEVSESKEIIIENIVREASVVPNTAYYYNQELGKLIRNPNYKA